MKKGSKKDEEGLKKEYERTGYLNKLAGEINRIIERQDKHFKPSDLYTRLQTLFRSEPLNNRFLLLKQLERLEINPKYPMDRMGETRVTTTISKSNIVVTVEAKEHPRLIKHKDNYYYYEVAVLQWDESDKEANKNTQFSDWVDMKRGGARFKFSFKRLHKTQHWLLYIEQRMGIDKVRTDLLATKAMQIITVGTFDKDDLTILKKRDEEMRATKKLLQKEEEKIVRVKAEWVG